MTAPTSSPPRRIGEPVLLLGIIGLMAAAFALLVPPFQICDEHAHFVRAYDISLGHLVSGPNPVLPPAVIAAVLRYPENMEEHKMRASDVAADAFHGLPLTPGNDPRLADDDTHHWLTHGILAAAVYCPIAYLPASLGIGIARLLGVPPVDLLYAGRLGDVLFFLLACTLAFRLAPQYCRMFAGVALLPMTLHQAGGVTADVMTIGLSFVVVACLLWLRQNAADRRSLVLIALLFAVWVVCKVSPWTFAALLLIPPYRFATRRKWIAYMGAVAAGMVVSILIWQALSRGNVETLRVRRKADGYDMSAKAGYIVAHPLAFAGAAITHCVRTSPRYLSQYVAGLGWSMRWMRPWIQRLCLLLLLIVAATEAASKPFSIRERLILLAVFWIGVGSLYLILFVADHFDGIQGRYFIPFSLFGLLAIRQNRVVLGNTVLTAVVAATGVIHGIVTLTWLWTRYYS